MKSLIDRWFGEDLDRAWYSKLTLEDDDEEDEKVVRQKVKALKKEYRTKHLIGNKKEILEELDSRLSAIKFPERVHRLMPSLSNGGKLKSLEYENLLFYGWICFEGLIKPETLENFKLLAFILSEFSSREVQKRSDIRLVTQEIDKFFKSFCDIYGRTNLDGEMEGIEAFMWKLNVHYLAHFPNMVQWFGPLTVQSAYPTESTYGVLASLVKTNIHISQQVCNKFISRYEVMSICSRIITTCSTPFLERFNYYFPKMCSQLLYNAKLKTEGFMIPKRAGAKPLTNDQVEILRNLKFDNTDDFVSLERVLWKGETVCTEFYNLHKATKTINHCLKIKIKNDSFKYFLIIHIFKCESKLLFVGKELQTSSKLNLYEKNNRKLSNLSFGYLRTYVTISNSFTKIDHNCFYELISYANINNKNYILEIFNRHS